jgi:hypothetical protein
MRTIHRASKRSGRFARRGLSATAGIAGVLLGWWLTGGVALAWGPGAHRVVNRWAVDTLRPEIRGFFEANRQYLIDHATEPYEWMKQDRFEQKRHCIYLDKYGTFPFLELPHAYQTALNMYGPGRLNRDGVLPWQIGRYSLQLTEALRAHKWDEAKLDAAVLGHYVADARDPLALTKNYDGQLTGQTGLATRFGIGLIDRYLSFFIFRPEDSVKIDDPTEHAFQICLESYTWVDHIILADRRSLEGLIDYTDEYYDRFYSQIGSVAMRQISTAAHDVGSYWYTAWLNAGRPALPDR